MMVGMAIIFATGANDKIKALKFKWMTRWKLEDKKKKD